MNSSFVSTGRGSNALRNTLLTVFAIVALCQLCSTFICGSDESSAEITTGTSGGMEYTLDTEKHTLDFYPCDDETYGRGVMSDDPYTWSGWRSAVCGDGSGYYSIKFNDGCKVISGTTEFAQITPFTNARISSLDLGAVETIKGYAFQLSVGRPDQNNSYPVDLKNVVNVGVHAWGDAKISSVTFGMALRDIGEMAFATDDRDKFKLPLVINTVEGVQHVGFAAFAFRYFETLDIPASLTEIEDLAFSGSSILKTITVDPQNPQFKVRDGALFSKDDTRILLYPAQMETNLASYELPDTVTKMDMGVFAFNSNIESIIIPKSVTVIPQAAFFYWEEPATGASSIKNIYYPDSVTNIYNTAYGSLELDAAVVSENFESVLTDNETGLNGVVQYKLVNLKVKEVYNDSAKSEQDVKTIFGNFNLDWTTVEYKGKATGTLNLDGITVTVDVGTSFQPDQPPSKDHCTFIGWTVDSEAFDPNFVSTISILPSMGGKTTNMYSCWATTVNYDLNGGTGDIPRVDTKIRDKVTLSDGSGISGPEGEPLASWNTAKDGSGTSYAPGSVLNVADYTVLYAQWGEFTLTVTFDVQGHGTAPARQTVDYGAKVTEPDAPSAEGYTFAGWYKEAACTTAWNFATDIVIDDVTLYAKWDEFTLTVTFNANGGEGTMTQQTIKYSDASKVLNLNQFTMTGYAFSGWKVTGGTTTYADGADVSALLTQVGGTLSLDAQWGESPAPSPTPSEGGGSGFLWIVVATSLAAILIIISVLVPAIKRRKDKEEQ